MTRRSSFLFHVASVSFVALLAGCGGSNPNDAFLPPPVVTEADAGQPPPPPPQSVIRITTTGTPTTNEAGGRATFAVALSAKPTSVVSVPIVSPTQTEIKAEPSALTFGPEDWDKPKTATLIGQNEDVDDGDQKVRIGVGPAVSSDAAWNGVRSDGIEALNQDDDVAGIEVSTPTPSSTTTETGTKVTFTVRLKSRPSAPVTIGVTSSVPTEGTVDKAQLVFDPADWQTPQTVTVTGTDDAVADVDKPYDVDLAKPVTSDPAYAALSATKLSFLNLDDDIPGFFVFPPALADRFTTEAGGTRSFTVRLRSKPTADVTIPLSSTNTNEGSLEGVTQLVFTPASYDQLQTVTVKGVDDEVDDDDKAYAITLAAASSADGTYQGKDAPDVDLTNKDDDTAAILVSAPSAALTTEGGTSVTFTVKLGSQPTASVTLSLVSSKPAEGAVDKAELVFTTGNWDQAQTVTVQGQDDLVDDGDAAYAIQIAHKVGSVTTDAKYAAIDPNDVNLTNSDDDAQGVTVSGPNNGTFTTEGGAEVTFDVVLKSKPTGDVTMPISISNDEATTDKAQLVFTATNWDQIQTVTVKGKDDFVDDGDRDFDVVFGTATGGGYNVNPADVTLKNVDDDTAAIQQTALTGALTEVGGQATFKVRLASRPAGTNQVTVPISITAGNATRNPTSLVFTVDNWNVEQEVTITGGGDMTLASTAPTVSVAVGAATSGDPVYSGKSAPGFTDIPNASACGIGGVNAGEGEECDDANPNACDACEACRRRQIVTIPAGSTATVGAAVMPAVTTNMCLELWARTTAATDAVIASSYGSADDGSFRLECKQTGDVRLATQTLAETIEAVSTVLLSPCSDGAWHHYLACREVTTVPDVKLTLFVDGALVASKTGSPLGVGMNADLVFGGTAFGGGSGFAGAIDEVRLSTVVRQTTGPFTPPRRHASTDADTRALWHLDEGAGAGKSVPTNYDLTLGAGAAWAGAESYSSDCN